MTCIPSMPVMTGSATPATTPDTRATTMLPVQVETAAELLMPVPIVEVPMQPTMVDSQLGGSYITNI